MTFDVTIKAKPLSKENLCKIYDYCELHQYENPLFNLYVCICVAIGASMGLDEISDKTALDNKDKIKSMEVQNILMGARDIIGRIILNKYIKNNV